MQVSDHLQFILFSYAKLLCEYLFRHVKLFDEFYRFLDFQVLSTIILIRAVLINSGLHCIKKLRIVLFLSGLDASSSGGYSQHFISWERQCLRT